MYVNQSPRETLCYQHCPLITGGIGPSRNLTQDLWGGGQALDPNCTTLKEENLGVLPLTPSLDEAVSSFLALNEY
jgi:hypothetical protein